MLTRKVSFVFCSRNSSIIINENQMKRTSFTASYSDGWADRQDVIDGLQSEAWGGISLRIRSPYVPDFDDYFKALTPKNNSRNPWFVEYWETRFNCTINSTTNPCPGKTQPQIQHVQRVLIPFIRSCSSVPQDTNLGPLLFIFSLTW